ncbi:TPA: hypothetical protein U2I65_003932 [Providencia stuartii]|nr:hypothetical protein [Providencia stuartii]
MSVDVGALSGIKTYREANDKFMKEIGTSGMGYVHFKYRPKQWEYCFGSFLETANGTDESHPVGCFNIPMVPIQCEVSSNGLDLQHGVFNSAQLNAANTTKSATGSFTVNCTRDASLMFELTEEQITLTDGLTANLRMTTNGQTIPNKSSLSINGNTVTTFDITSTLNATGKIPPNSYSANAILIITAE